MKTILVVVMVILLFLAVTPALADPPDHFSYTFDEAPWPIADCGDFTVMTDAMIHVDAKVLYDKEGNPTQTHEQWTIDGIWYSPETGVSATQGTHKLNTVHDLETGEWKSSGIQFKLTAPGAGKLLIDVGRLIFDADFSVTFATGPHPVYSPEEGDFDKLCAYFAEP